MTTVSTANASGRMVVARFRDGRLVRGTTHDFFPAKAEFHVYEYGDEKVRAIKVPVRDLKAIFFVKSYTGNASGAGGSGTAAVGPQGRKIEVEFEDGEKLTGFTMAYNPEKPGFFVTPDDHATNNTRVFVVRSAIRDVRFL